MALGGGAVVSLVAAVKMEAPDTVLSVTELVRVGAGVLLRPN